MEIKNKTLILGAVLLAGAILSSFLLLTVGDYSRAHTEYFTEIPDSNGQSLCYRVWGIPERAPETQGEVIIMFPGFSSQQENMYPLMREFTMRGYNVITADWRGQGKSGGILPFDTEILVEDFDLVVEDASVRYPDWNWTQVTMIGHSMGGEAALAIGALRDVFNTIAVAPMPYITDIDPEVYNNLFVITGDKDQLIPVDGIFDWFQNIVPGAELGTFYGSFETSTMRAMEVVPGANHEFILADDVCIQHIVHFVLNSYGNQIEMNEIEIHQSLRVYGIFASLIIGIIGICAFCLGLKFQWTNIPEKEPQESPEKRSLQEKNITLEEMTWKEFLKSYIVYLPLGFVFVMILFAASLLTGGSFVSSQVIFLGLPGMIALVFLWRRTNTKEENASRLKLAWKDFWSQLTWKKLGLALICSIVSLILVVTTLGQVYMYLFPLNLRILNSWFYFPVFLVSLWAQGWVFQEFLKQKEKDERTNQLWKAIGFILLLKFGIYYGLGLGILLTGDLTITLIGQLTMIDVIGTIFYILEVKRTGSMENFAIWTAICANFVYLGYSAFNIGFLAT